MTDLEKVDEIRTQIHASSLAKIESIRLRLADYLRDHPEVTQSSVARGIVKSPAVISMFMKNAYKGEVYAVAIAVDNWLNRQEHKRFVAEVPFVMTSVAARVFQAAELCQTTNSMGLLVGRSGVGKTKAAQAFAYQHPEVVLVETFPGDTQAAVVREINKRSGGDGKGNFTTLFESTVQILKGTDRLIIIDESENLPAKTLNVIRRIHDLTGVGVLYVGLFQFGAMVNGLRGDYDYILNRISVPVKLTDPTVDDAKLMLGTIIPECNGLADIFHSLSLGCARKMVAHAQQCLRILSLPENQNFELNESFVRKVWNTIKTEGLGHA